MSDGRTETIVPYQSDGTKNEPLARYARMAKFRSLTRNLQNDAGRAALIAEVDRLDHVTDMAAWITNVNAILSRGG